MIIRYLHLIILFSLISLFIFNKFLIFLFIFSCIIKYTYDLISKKDKLIKQKDNLIQQKDNDIKQKDNLIKQNIINILSKHNYLNHEIVLNKIPKKIFQTHKSQDYVNNNQVLKDCQKTWKSNIEYEYYFYSDSDIDKFIKNNFNKDVYKAFTLCPVPVMKADLWRYCVIYLYGGIYSDIDTELITNINIFEKNALFIGVPENKIHICNWVFAAPIKSPILEETINLSVKRILEYDFTKIDDHYIHYLTGPGCLTDGFENFIDKMNLPKLNIRNRDFYKYFKLENYLYIYDNLNFHKEYVDHKFSGSWPDGWTFNRF